MKNSAARDLYLGQPVGPATGCNQQQRHGERMNRTANLSGVCIQSTKQRAVGIQIHIEPENTQQTQTKGFGVPARVLCEVSEQLLDQ